MWAETNGNDDRHRKLTVAQSDEDEEHIELG
jgi:hypothetical protein